MPWPTSSELLWPEQNPSWMSSCQGSRIYSQHRQSGGVTGYSHTQLRGSETTCACEIYFQEWLCFHWDQVRRTCLACYYQMQHTSCDVPLMTV